MLFVVLGVGHMCTDFEKDVPMGIWSVHATYLHSLLVQLLFPHHHLYINTRDTSWRALAQSIGNNHSKVTKFETVWLNT